MQRIFLVLIALGALSWAVQHHREASFVSIGSSQSGAPGELPAPKVGPVAATAAPAAKPEPRVISHGEPVTLTQYLTPGKWTVFDFYSDFCPPCRHLKPALEKLHANRADVNLVVVDINRPGLRSIDFDSPVAQEYGVHSIPRLVVYDPKGALYAQDTDVSDAGRQLVFQWLTSL